MNNCLLLTIVCRMRASSNSGFEGGFTLGVAHAIKCRMAATLYSPLTWVATFCRMSVNEGDSTSMWVQELKRNRQFLQVNFKNFAELSL